MRQRRFWVVGLAVAILLIASACRTPASTPTAIPTSNPSLPTANGDIQANPTPSHVPAISTETSPVPTDPPPLPTDPPPTDAPPTATPLPTWPARWEPTGGPPGGVIEAVAVDPRNGAKLYAAGLGGVVYRSDDGGATWSPSERLAPPSCPFSDVVIDAADAATVYAANTCAGVFTSTDGGASWARSSGDAEGGMGLLVQSPHTPGVLLAAGQNGQVFRSLDGALSWQPVSDGLPGDPISGLAASGPDTYWATTDNGVDGNLYRFSGAAWANAAFGQPPNTRTTSVLVDPIDPARVYVGLSITQPTATELDEPTLLYRSNDGGWNWIPVHTPIGVPDLDNPSPDRSAFLRVLGKGQTSGVLYVSDSDGLLSSTEDAETFGWVQLPEGVHAANGLRQMAIDPTNNDVLYLPLGGRGIIRSVDLGLTWHAIDSDFMGADLATVRTHPTDPATLYTASATDPSTFRSFDYGDSWEQVITGAETDREVQRIAELAFDPNQPSTLYQINDAAGSFRSDDGGASWSAAWPEFRFSSIYALVIAPSDPNIIYASKNGYGLFRSDDGGNGWSFLPQSGVLHTYALAVNPENPGFVLSGESGTMSETGAELRRSKDRGETWDVVLDLPDATGITAVAIDTRVEPFFRRGTEPPDPTRLYAASVGRQGALWFSNDAGDSWNRLNDGLNFTDVDILAVAPHRPGTAYAGLRGGGNWRTDDGGLNWQRVSGDPATSAAAISIDPNNIVYIADGTTPHLYRSADDGNTWELLFNAGDEYERLAALAIAPSDPRIVFVSASAAGGVAASGAVFRIDTNAPYGENATDITGDLPSVPSKLAVHRHDARRIYALAPGAPLWKTMDEGATWRRISSGLPDVPFLDLATDPAHSETLFIAGGHNGNTAASEAAVSGGYGIWKSTDDGNTWTKVGGSTFGQSTGPIKSITFHPEDDRVLYAAGASGIYLSPDRGDTWTDISGRLPPISMNAVATDGQVLYAGTAGSGLFHGPIHPLIRTADWYAESRLAAPIHNIQITLDPDDPQTLYATAYPGGVFKTTDGGTTWSERNTGLPSYAVADPQRQGHYALAIAPSARDVLYVGLDGNGVFRSDDGAATWRPVFGTASELERASVQALLVHPSDPEIVYAATEKGIWRSVNGGGSWSDFGTGLPPGGDVRTLVLSADDRLYAGSRGYGLITRPAFLQAEDEGWHQLPELANWGVHWPSRGDIAVQQHTSLLIQPGNSNVLYAGTFPAGFFKTVDGGTTWREHNVGLGNAGVLTLAANSAGTDSVDAQVIYAGTTSGIFRSIDSGVSWHRWDAGWPSGQWVSSIAIDPTDPDSLYASSSNNDASQQIGGTVMKSTDGGATWFEITTGLDLNQTFKAVLIDRFDRNIVYLGTERDGVFVSRDGGATWSSWNEGLWNQTTGSGTMADVLQASADGRLLYLGTSGAGVWRRPAEGAP